jgi:hypothetical protein
VLVKPCVFNGEQAIAHQFRDVVKRQVLAFFTAKATNLYAISGVDPQRLLGLVVSQPAGVGQLRQHHHDADHQSQQHQQTQREPAAQKKTPSKGASGFC